MALVAVLRGAPPSAGSERFGILDCACLRSYDLPILRTTHPREDIDGFRVDGISLVDEGDESRKY